MNKFTPEKPMADAIRLPMLNRKEPPGVKHLGLYLVARSTMRITPSCGLPEFNKPNDRDLAIPSNATDVRYICFPFRDYPINDYSTFARFAYGIQEAISPRLLAESRTKVILANPEEAAWSFYLEANGGKHAYLHLKITPETWEAVKDRVLNESSGLYRVKVVAHLQHSGVVKQLQENDRDIDELAYDHASWESGMLSQFRNSKMRGPGAKSMRNEAAWFGNTSGFPQCVIL